MDNFDEPLMERAIGETFSVGGIKFVVKECKYCEDCDIHFVAPKCKMVIRKFSGKCCGRNDGKRVGFKALNIPQ